MIATRLVQCENVLDLSGVYWDQVESTVHHETEHKILRHFVQWDDDGIDLLQNLNVLTDACRNGMAQSVAKNEHGFPVQQAK